MPRSVQHSEQKLVVDRFLTASALVRTPVTCRAYDVTRLLRFDRHTTMLTSCKLTRENKQTKLVKSEMKLCHKLD